MSWQRNTREYLLECSCETSKGHDRWTGWNDLLLSSPWHRTSHRSCRIIHLSYKKPSQPETGNDETFLLSFILRLFFIWNLHFFFTWYLKIFIISSYGIWKSSCFLHMVFGNSHFLFIWFLEIFIVSPYWIMESSMFLHTWLCPGTFLHSVNISWKMVDS